MSAAPPRVRESVADAPTVKYTCPKKLAGGLCLYVDFIVFHITE